MEKTIKAAQGFLVLLLVTILLVGGIYALTQIKGADHDTRIMLIWFSVIDFTVVFTKVRKDCHFCVINHK